jgi:hypothetical protein
MSLHRLTRVVMGVPNVAETAAYYEEFGLDPWATTRSGPATAASSSRSSTPRPGAWSSSASVPITTTTSPKSLPR